MKTPIFKQYKKMKNFFLILIFLLFASRISAQTYNGAELIIGAKGGLTLSTGSFQDTSGVSEDQNGYYHLWGLTGGAVFRYSGEKYIGLQIEANFCQRGWAKHGEFSRRLNYVQIPVLTHVFFGKKWFRFFINAGPEIAFLINEKNDNNSDNKFVSEKIKNRFDYGFSLGGGFEFHTKAGIYQIEGRYEFGLGDVFANNPNDTFRRSANRNVLMTLGVLFNLKKKNINR